MNIAFESVTARRFHDPKRLLDVYDFTFLFFINFSRKADDVIAVTYTVIRFVFCISHGTVFGNGVSSGIAFVPAPKLTTRNSATPARRFESRSIRNTCARARNRDDCYFRVRWRRRSRWRTTHTRVYCLSNIMYVVGTHTSVTTHHLYVQNDGRVA